MRVAYSHCLRMRATSTTTISLSLSQSPLHLWSSMRSGESSASSGRRSSTRFPPPPLPWQVCRLFFACGSRASVLQPRGLCLPSRPCLSSWRLECTLRVIISRPSQHEAIVDTDNWACQSCTHDHDIAIKYLIYGDEVHIWTTSY